MQFSKNQKLIIIFSALFFISVVLYTSKDKITSYVNEVIWDIVTQQRIAQLHPLIQPYVKQFILNAQQQGIELRVVSGYRTFAEQDALYAQGRTTSGQIVTNAKGGQSLHNYGLAVDVVQMINGQPMWDYNLDAISAIGKQLGFEWGGDWTSFKDYAHYQMTFGYTLSDLQNLYAQNKVDSNGYLILS
jgi:peptidoglycan L-alanyl-D-glutamate endopeptidase CwlK